MGRIDHGANRPAIERNVHGAKRTMGETSRNPVDRLKCIGSQDALFFLRSSFITPRVHLLRCSSSVDHPALLEYDELLGSSRQLISNSVLPND
jgi:hypothetical protein